MDSYSFISIYSNLNSRRRRRFCPPLATINRLVVVAPLLLLHFIICTAVIVNCCCATRTRLFTAVVFPVCRVPRNDADDDVAAAQKY